MIRNMNFSSIPIMEDAYQINPNEIRNNNGAGANNNPLSVLRQLQQFPPARLMVPSQDLTTSFSDQYYPAEHGVVRNTEFQVDQQQYQQYQLQQLQQQLQQQHQLQQQQLMVNSHRDPRNVSMAHQLSSELVPYMNDNLYPQYQVQGQQLYSGLELENGIELTKFQLSLLLQQQQLQQLQVRQQFPPHHHQQSQQQVQQQPQVPQPPQEYSPIQTQPVIKTEEDMRFTHPFRQTQVSPLPSLHPEIYSVDQRMVMESSLLYNQGGHLRGEEFNPVKREKFDQQVGNVHYGISGHLMRVQDNLSASTFATTLPNDLGLLSPNESKSNSVSPSRSPSRKLLGKNTSDRYSSPPGPIPATIPELSVDPNTGEEMITFYYSSKKVVTKFCLLCPKIDMSKPLNLDKEFMQQNCIYPGALCPVEQYQGKRGSYERECNRIGWELAYWNPEIRNRRGLIQRAVDSWRNTRQDLKIRSRRVRKEHRKKTRPMGN